MSVWSDERTRGCRLENWPKDWADYPDEQLADLLRTAAPRSAAEAAGPDTPQRRWGDAPSEPSQHNE